jgi:anti-sigma factor RsiW
MPELHLLTGAYALDALDDVERGGFERHLRSCDTCMAEVTDFHEATAALANRVAATPPEGMRLRVLEEVARTRQVAPSTHRRLPRISFRRTLAVAAATVIVAGGAGLGGIAYQGHQAAQQAQVRPPAWRE